MKREKVMGTKKWFYWVSIGIVLIAIYKLLDNFSGIGEWISNLFSVIAPFLGGILIAYILYIPCKKIENLLLKTKVFKNKARGLSIAIVYFLTIIAIVWFMNVIIPILTSSIKDLINNIQTYYNSVMTESPDLSITPYIQENILKPIVEWIKNINLEDMFTIDKIQDYLSSAMGVVKGIVNAFIAIICSIYILSQRNRIIQFFDRLSKAMFTKQGYRKYKRYFVNGNGIFFKYLSSQVIDAVIIAVVTSIFMSFIGVKHAVFLGTLIGLSNLIPYFGAIVGSIVAILITILTGGWEQALVMGIGVIIIQQIDANIINPRITSSTLKVSPLLVMFAVTVGGAYFGILGMFLAVPIFTLLKIIIEDYIEGKNIEKLSDDVYTQIEDEMWKS